MAGGLILKQARELGIEGPFFGGDVWNSPEIITSAGEAAEGIMFTFPAQYTGEEYQKFTTAFKEKYGTEPDVNASQAYDTMKVIALVMKKTGFKPEDIKVELHKVKRYKGVTGEISFDENGDRIGMTYAKRIVKEGKIIPYHK